jgi:hypothetical protein
MFLAPTCTAVLVDPSGIHLVRCTRYGRTIKCASGADPPSHVHPLLQVWEGARGEYDEKTIACSVADMQDSQTLVLQAT